MEITVVEEIPGCSKAGERRGDHPACAPPNFVGRDIGDIEGGWNEICQKHHQIDGRPREIDELLKAFDRKRFLKSGTPCTSFTARIVPARGSEKNISVLRAF
jgi:hypothetical protein